MNEFNDKTYSNIIFDDKQSRQMHNQPLQHHQRQQQQSHPQQPQQDIHDKRKSHLKKSNYEHRYPHLGSSQSLATVRDLNYCDIQTLSRSSSQKKREKRKLENVFPLSSYRNQSEAGIGNYVESNYDNFDVRSHYSDTIAATGTTLVASATSPPPSSVIAISGGIGVSSSITAIPRLSRTNQNVTFSNCAEERIHSNHRGSLKRYKGRSNQSLCSCDAEPDTDIALNPNRPLYQYSLDRKNKSHTYTCEQNAQILMRLERERQQKSLAALSSVDKQIKDVKEYFTDDNPMEVTNVYPAGSTTLEGDSITDVDVIPPPPAPPAISLERKQSSSYQQNFIKGYTSSVLKPTESMLNDCTATILNCANVGGSSGGGESSTSGSASGTISNISKPDLCNINRSVKSKKADGGSSKGRSNQENIPLTPYTFIKDDTYIPCFKDKGEDSVFFYHQEPPQYIPNFETQPHPGKYNTIGPSSFCAKQFLGYQQNNPQQCNFELFNSGNLSQTGRYFSQSLSNFSLSEQQQQQHHDGYHLLQHKHDFSRTTTPYTQFQSTATDLNCSPGDSALLGSSYTSLGSSTTNINFKGKLHQHQEQQQQQQQQQQHLSSHMPWRHRQCSSRGSSSSGTSSLRFDPSRHWLAVSSILLIVGAASVAVPLALRVAASAPFEERLQAATQLLEAVPLIDGHNDLPWNIRKFLHNKLNDFDFDADLKVVMPWARSHWSHTDLQRLKKGRVSAQFWAAYVPCEAQYRDAVQLILEQIDVIKRLTDRYSPQLTTCTSASDIIEAHKNHQLCSLTGVEGGHSIGGSLAVLRTLYTIGVRYMTLTSTCHTPWADSSIADAPKYDVKHGGLTVFGKTIIREMNRLGMIVDLSHVSANTMRDALATSEAPVIFSHSSAYELCNSSRNVQDDVLQLIAKNGGLVMVNFYSKFLSCSENSTVHDAVAHINHIKRIAGIDHVGLGAGFDGINFTPVGLEDVSAYPTLFAELLGEGWSIEDLTKLAGQNFLRVMHNVERIRDEKRMAGMRPIEDHPNFRSEDPYNCTSS